MDIGEGFPFDADLIALATSANVCCGEHAGSWKLTVKTVEMCQERGVRIGAHPGYPDRANMGRKAVVEPQLDEYLDAVEAQIERFAAEFETAYLKPHGALYAAVIEGAGAAAVCLRGAAQKWGVPIMVLAGSSAKAAFSPANVPVILEGFADRRYDGKGALIGRHRRDAVLTDLGEIRDQVLRLAGEVDSICVHGDHPGCVPVLESVRRALEDARFEVRA